MEGSRYWLRHPSLRGLVGPYSLPELRAAIEAKSLPADGYVLRDEGQDETTLRSSPHWRPAWEMLGLPPPTSRTAAAQPAAPLDQRRDAVARRARLRERTAYSSARTAIRVVRLLFVAMVGATLLLGVFGISTTDGSASFKGIGIAVAIAWTMVEILIVLVVAALAQALLDIADASMPSRD